MGSEINRRMMIRIRIRIIMALPVIDELNSRVLLACLLACLPACLRSSRSSSSSVSLLSGLRK